MPAYEQTADRQSLEASVEAVRRAAEQTPSEDDKRAERLNNLVSALLALYERTGDPERSMRPSVRPAQLSPPPTLASHRASCLYGLASGLFRRGELRRTLLDFDEAAALARQAVEATPEDHAIPGDAPRLLRPDAVLPAYRRETASKRTRT